MAEIVETFTREDGHVINVYASGVHYDMTAKHVIKAPPSAQITKENAHVYIRARQEKQARLLRESITNETNDKLEMKYSGPAAAVAAAGGILWREVVLADPDKAGVYPRDRLEAWEKLGKYAQVLPADVRQAPDDIPAAAVAGLVAGAAATMARILADVIQAKTIQPADVIDIRSDNEQDNS